MRFQAISPRLAQHLPHFRVVAAVIHKVDILFLQASNQGGEIFFTGGNTIKKDNIGIALLQAILHGARQSFAVLLFIVNDSDALRFHRFQDVFRGRWPLGGVQSGGTHNVLIAALGQLRVSRPRGNHQNTFIFIDIGCWLSRRRTQVTNNVLNTVVNDFVGHRYRLFWIAGIIVLYADQLIAFNPAFSVDVFNGLARAVKFHIAPLRYRAGHRPDYGDFNIICHCPLRDC